MIKIVDTKAIAVMQKRGNELEELVSSYDIGSALYGDGKASIAEAMPLALAAIAVKQHLTRKIKIGDEQRSLMDLIYVGLAGHEFGFLLVGSGHCSQEMMIDPVVHAVLRGFALTGNEFNIFFGGDSGRFYPTREGLYRKLITWPGLTGLHETVGRVEMKDGQCRVPVTVAYQLDGERKMHKFPALPVMSKGKMTEAAAEGKAIRKAYLRVWHELTNQAPPTTAQESTPDELIAEDVRGAEEAEEGLFEKHEQAS